MTGEGKGETERYIRSNKVAHGYAYDRTGELTSFFGVRGIPHAVLIGPDRKILWRGHPASLRESTIEATLEKAMDVPLWEWPKEAKALSQAIRKQRWAKALEEAAELDREEVGSYVAPVRAMIEGQGQRLESLYGEQNYLEALEVAKAMERSMKGLPQGERAKQLTKLIKGDKEAKRVLKGQAAFRKLIEEAPRTKRDADELAAKLEKLLANYPDTYVVTEVNEFLAELQTRRKRLRK